MVYVLKLLLTFCICRLSSSSHENNNIEGYAHKQEVYLKRLQLHDRKFRDNLELTRIDDARRRNATCMDGSDAKYYISRQPLSTNWVIHLQGGGSCITFDDCQLRSKGSLGSSVPLNQKVTGEWMLSDDPSINPTFYHWNKVFIPYCSGDVFVGRKLKKHHSYRMPMLGHYIVVSVIEDLKKHHKINSKRSKILFGGTSAGGIGVLANIDHVAKLTNPAKVQGYNDGGWFTLYPTFGETAHKTSKMEYALPKFFGTLTELFDEKWDGFVDESCRINMSSPAACLYGEVAISYINSPMFVMSFLWDTYQLTRMMLDQNEAIQLPPSTNEEISFLMKFGNHSHRSMKRIRHHKRHGVFAPACYSHTFFTSCIGGILCDFPKDIVYSNQGKSAYGALSDWFRTGGRKGSYIDEMGKSLTCNPSCCSKHCRKCSIYQHKKDRTKVIEHQTPEEKMRQFNEEKMRHFNEEKMRHFNEVETQKGTRESKQKFIYYSKASKLYSHVVVTTLFFAINFLMVVK